MCAPPVAGQSSAREPRGPDQRGDQRGEAARVEHRPRLVVVIVVDQLRTDYIEKFGHHWTGGLRRLIDQGAWFRLSEYPYWNTVTCPGHSTIGTGAFPSAHGMILNAWWDRERGERMACTADPKLRLVTRAGPSESGPGDGPWRLRLPTLADEMRIQLGGKSRVVTISLKARSAIGLAGHRGDAVIWWEGDGFVTSTAYAQKLPDFVEEYMRVRPVTRDLGKTWEKLLPPHTYLYDDEMPGERRRAGRISFPHAVGSGPEADNTFYTHWRRSPFSDAYLGELAKAALDSLKLGTGEATDFLGVSFSALDYVGHDFGPRSHEVQDTLARLDRTIGELFEHLDRAVGRDNYVVALSADHGVAPIPDQTAEEGLEAGRLNTSTMVRRLEEILSTHLGPGRHIARFLYTELYFAPGVYDRLRSNPAALDAVMAELRNTPGVARVFRGDELAGRPATDDPLMRAAALGYHPGRSGDLIVLAKPLWIATGTDATTHGSGYTYDRRVPVILLGPAFRPGDYYSPASPADIAPTLGHLLGVILPAADGRVLGEALAPRRPASTPRR